MVLYPSRNRWRSGTFASVIRFRTSKSCAQFRSKYFASRVARQRFDDLERLRMFVPRQLFGEERSRGGQRVRSRPRRSRCSRRRDQQGRRSYPRRQLARPLWESPCRPSRVCELRSAPTTYTSPATFQSARTRGVDLGAGEQSDMSRSKLSKAGAAPQDSTRNCNSLGLARWSAHTAYRLGLAVAHQEGDLGRGHPEVDRHGNGAELVDRQERLDELGSVEHQDQHTVAELDPTPAQRPRPEQ